MEDRIRKVRNLFAQHGGIMRTSELAANGIYYKRLREFLEHGYIEQIRRGYYCWAEGEVVSDAAIVTELYPDAILCMDTALLYYDYTDRTPAAWHLAVDRDAAKSRFDIDYPTVKPHYTESSKLQIGESAGIIDGVNVKIYDRERTVCDCFVNRNKMDREIFNTAIRKYVRDQQKNIPRLMEYAKALRVEKPILEVIGVWL